ncbi:hypothetical protein [Mesorhizobium sp.]|uniref:hypothetical protein n=1 Tax=Mesorhizobium sp. TaxID=1871066 RepID=UPI000FE9FA3A|nr:hypothetical protein [Mesorhizobium sp.]RWP05086.1 MAG: hypothetical protein EOQ99_16580 [Mesorhizobium sp.]
MTTIDEHKQHLAQKLTETAKQAAPPQDPNQPQAAGFLPAMSIWALIAGPLIDTFAQMLKEALEERDRRPK